MFLEYKVKILEIIQRSYNVKSFRLEVPENFNFKAGQFFLVTLLGDLELKRYLSISSSPTERNHIEFTKKITGSDFSQSLDRLKVDDKIFIQQPLGKFILDLASPKVAFLCGGIGITPVRSICQDAIDRKLNTDMILLYANHKSDDIVFGDDFRRLQKSDPGFKITHILGEAEPEFICTVGRINSQIIKHEIPDYLQRKFYLCGPPQMVEAMRKILIEELTLESKNIVMENFQGY